MTKRYEVVNGVITEVYEERTALSPDATAELLNNKQAHIEGLLARIEGLLARIAELEAEHPQPPVTPEWLAEAFKNAMHNENPDGWVCWDKCCLNDRKDYIAAAKRVLDQMPAPAAPVVVDAQRLIDDYEAAPYRNSVDSIEYGLEAQGVKCK